MHPFLSNRKVLFAYLVVWFVIGLLFATAAYASFGEQAHSLALFIIPVVEFFGVAGLSSYYLCRSFPLTGTKYTTLLSVFFTAAASVGGVAALFGYGWAQWIDGLNVGIPLVRKDQLFLILAVLGGGALVFLLMAAVHYLIIGLEYARESQKQTLALRITAQEAELRALRAQLNPHFLFNSLNSILSLISTQPQQAEAMTQKLADFFRRSLKHHATAMISLQEELEIVQDYLDIEKVRFGQRLAVDIQCDETTRSFRVPALLLQPLVENAIRHGIAQKVEGGTLRIVASMAGSKLRIRIENPFDSETNSKKGTETGLRNVRLRLFTLYGQEAWLTTEERNELFAVELLLPPYGAKIHEVQNESTTDPNDHR